MYPSRACATCARCLQKNPILQDRMIDVGILSAEDAIAWSVTGPVLRASGVAVRRAQGVPVQRLRERTSSTSPTRTEGDAYARFLVRLDEMDQSMRIIEQVPQAARRRRAR